MLGVYAPSISSEYLAFLETVGRVQEGTPFGESINLLEERNYHVGKDSKTWKSVTGRKRLPSWNPTAALLLDFCDNHSLSITNAIYQHRSLQLDNWSSVSFGHLVEERSWAVDWSPASGELDQMVEEGVR